MSRPQPFPVSPQSHAPLSETASSIVCRIPQLLRRLRDLESEEAKLDTRARQLVQDEQPPKAIDKPSTPSRPNVFTPPSKIGRRLAADRGTQSSSPHIDPRNIETPVKTFLLVESFALAMSIKSKRRGRIFMTGDSTEFGERI